MQYANVDGGRVTAAPGLIGECPHCGSEVLSKCGDTRVWHWSHRGKRHCDQWWEPETEWHRNWKGHFPVEWHEISHRALSGERHVADIKASHGLVIEFQYSAITQAERNSRTSFYQNMAWVVNGLRRKRDRPRFLGSVHDWRRLHDNMWLLDFPEEALPRDWLDCKVPVFFDFGADAINGDPSPQPAKLWCLLPRPLSTSELDPRLMIELTASAFVDEVKSGRLLLEWKRIFTKMIEAKQAEKLALADKAKEQHKRLRQWRWARRNGLS